MPAVASLLPPAAARRRRFSPAAASLQRGASRGGSSWRGERRLMSELGRTVTAGAMERVIRSYVSTKSECAALVALSCLLMDSDPLAIPFYEMVTQARWFKWSSSHAAAVAALLETNSDAEESRSFVSDSVARLQSASELALFYCDLMAAFSSRGLRHRAMDFYAQLREAMSPLSGSSKTYTEKIKSLVRRRCGGVSWARESRVRPEGAVCSIWTNGVVPLETEYSRNMYRYHIVPSIQPNAGAAGNLGPFWYSYPNTPLVALANLFMFY